MKPRILDHSYFLVCFCLGIKYILEQLVRRDKGSSMGGIFFRHLRFWRDWGGGPVVYSRPQAPQSEEKDERNQDLAKKFEYLLH